MSNYWKKPGQHKIDDYIDLKIVIRPFIEKDLPLVQKFHIYEGHITPDRMVENGNVYEIKYLDPLFILNGFMVITENNMVKNILIFGYHPNQDPDTHLYCLPDLKKNILYDDNYYNLLLRNIKTYYLDNCFFKPTKIQAQYKKIKSMFIKLNPGENE